MSDQPITVKVQRERTYGDVQVLWDGRWALAWDTRACRDCFSIEFTIAETEGQSARLAYRLTLFLLDGNKTVSVLDDPIDRHHAELQAMIAYKQAVGEALLKW